MLEVKERGLVCLGVGAGVLPHIAPLLLLKTVSGLLCCVVPSKLWNNWGGDDQVHQVAIKGLLIIWHLFFSMSRVQGAAELLVLLKSWWTLWFLHQSWARKVEVLGKREAPCLCEWEKAKLQSRSRTKVTNSKWTEAPTVLGPSSHPASTVLEAAALGSFITRWQDGGLCSSRAVFSNCFFIVQLQVWLSAIMMSSFLWPRLVVGLGQTELGWDKGLN